MLARFERVFDDLSVEGGGRANMNNLHIWILENATIIRFHLLDTKLCGEAIAPVRMAGGSEGADVNKTQAADCFQMHATHEAGPKNRGSHSLFHRPLPIRARPPQPV